MYVFRKSFLNFAESNTLPMQTTRNSIVKPLKIKRTNLQQNVMRLLPRCSDLTTFVHANGESPPTDLLRLSAATSSAWWHWITCATIRPVPSTLTASSPFCAGNFENIKVYFVAQLKNYVMSNYKLRKNI